MIIRVADLEKDAVMIMDGAMDFVSRMDFTDFLPERKEDIASAITRVLNMPFVETVVAEHNGKIIGGIGIAYIPCLWNANLLTGEELFWWTSKAAPKTAALKLLKFVKQRMIELGVEIMSFKQLTSSPESVAKVYKRMGLRQVETSFMGRL